MIFISSTKLFFVQTLLGGGVGFAAPLNNRVRAPARAKVPPQALCFGLACKRELQKERLSFFENTDCFLIPCELQNSNLY